MSANSVFQRLDYNQDGSFDESKFGGSLYLTDGSKTFLSAAKLPVKEWQQNEIADANVGTRSRYYKNPVVNSSSWLTANTVLIEAIANNDPANTFTYAPAEGALLAAAANTFIRELTYFVSHSANMCGLVSATSEFANIPNYDMAVAVGTQILSLTHTTDNVANSSPMLGSFTSLFINDELTANSQTLYNDYITLSTSIVSGNVTLSASNVSNITAHITSANNLISTRRNHDWNFYENSRQILNDYIFLSRFSNIGNTQLYLINNLIGTDYLKENVANN